MPFLFEPVVFLTMSSRISSDHKWNCWHVHTNTVLLFFFSFAVKYRDLRIGERIERLTEWDEMSWCSIVKHNTLYNFFLFFCPQLLLLVAALLQIRRKNWTVDQVIKFRYTRLLQKEIALLHFSLSTSYILARLSMSTYSYIAMYTIRICMHVCMCVIVDEPWQIGSFIVLNYTIDRIFCRNRERNDSWPCRV
jgi:hypothetical protein